MGQLGGKQRVEWHGRHACLPACLSCQLAGYAGMRGNTSSVPPKRKGLTSLPATRLHACISNHEVCGAGVLIHQQGAGAHLQRLLDVGSLQWRAAGQWRAAEGSGVQGVSDKEPGADGPGPGADWPGPGPGAENGIWRAACGGRPGGHISPPTQACAHSPAKSRDACARTWEVLPEASGVWKLVVSLPKGRLAMKGEMLTASTRLQSTQPRATKGRKADGRGDWVGGQHSCYSCPCPLPPHTTWYRPEQLGGPLWLAFCLYVCLSGWLAGC